VWQLPRLTRGHIWILALAAHQPEIKWLRALLLHLDDNKLSPAASGLYADDVAITHGCGGASRGLFSDRSGRPGVVRWCRGVPGTVEKKPLANVSQDPVLVKMIPAPGFDDTAEEQPGQGPYVSCGRAISKRRLTSAKATGREGNFMFPAARRTCRQKRVEQAGSTGPGTRRGVWPTAAPPRARKAPDVAVAPCRGELGETSCGLQ
jgi:hypothetical protein